MTDFENLIYFIPICGLILVCFLKCCYYDLSNKNIRQLQTNINTNNTERIPIINDRFPVILYTVENNNNNNNNNIENDNNILIDLENNYNLQNTSYETSDIPPSYESLKHQ